MCEKGSLPVWSLSCRCNMSKYTKPFRLVTNKGDVGFITSAALCIKGHVFNGIHMQIVVTKLVIRKIATTAGEDI